MFHRNMSINRLLCVLFWSVLILSGGNAFAQKTKSQLEAIETQVAKISEAEDKIEAINKHFSQ